MKELSIFVDESGDFGEYDSRSPFYIISMVMHDQAVDITENLICTIKLAELKLEKHMLSKSEKFFFEDVRTLRKNYLKPISQKEM